MANSTAEVIDRFYQAFFAGDAEGMLAPMDDDVEVRFLGIASVRGIEAARALFAFMGGLLADLDFEIRSVTIDGDVAAIAWDETATTLDGAPWVNHGVDVIHVREGRIVKLHENNDVREVHKHFPPYATPPR